MIQKKKDNLNSNKNNIRIDIIDWNNKYPFDYIWRKKYGVAFGSSEHRHMSFLDMIFDLEEDKMMTNLYKQRESNKQLTQRNENEISDEEFDEINIDDFNHKE